MIGLGLTGLLLLSPRFDPQLGLYLVAPFGASSVLLFAAPNSPLAQPWSAIAGNTVAAVVGVGVCMTIGDPTMRIALAVGLAITAMLLVRAIHPPAGAVAMTAAMSPEPIAQLGFWFALAPIGVGTITLVILATIYARLTGRHYPLRQFDDPSTHGTDDRNPWERLGLSEDELGDILGRYRQSFNLGVEDLARLIGAAELQSAANTLGPMTAQDIMSRDLVTVSPTTALGEIADLFRRHRFTSLPVVDREARFIGIIFQLHLIDQAGADRRRPGGRFLPSLRRLLDRSQGRPAARHVMSTTGSAVTPLSPISDLLPLMADGGVDAVPVIDRETLVGIVTQTDLVAALARRAAHQG